MTDIEIARNTELKKITEIAKDLDITEDEIEMYGKYKAKISREVNEKLVVLLGYFCKLHSADF